MLAFDVGSEGGALSLILHYEIVLQVCLVDIHLLNEVFSPLPVSELMWKSSIVGIEGEIFSRNVG